MRPGRYGKIDVIIMDEKLFQGIYKNKRVLVTGHTGFKGSWLSMWLLYLGAEVIGYSLEPVTDPNLFEILELNEKITHITGDIRNEESLNTVLKEHKPEIVFHLAAQPLVRHSYKEPRLTYEINVIGTINLFEAIRNTKSVRVVINVTSDKCYENREYSNAYSENDPMGGYDPYSSSKGCAELVTAAYRKSFFNPNEYGKNHSIALSTVRAGNVIGGGDWSEDRLIPDCIKSLTRNEPVYLRCPEALRPWQYVLEPLSGYLWIGALMWKDGTSYSDGWNFGPDCDDTLNVEEVVKTVINLWGDGEYKILRDQECHEAMLLKLDISKAYSLLKWKPVYKAKEALEKTLAWYKKYYQENRDDICAYTLAQLNEYVADSRENGLQWSA